MSPTDDHIRMTAGVRYAAVFLFLFSIALAAGNLLFTSSLVHKANANTALIAANTASVSQLCEAANEGRASQIRLWTFIISISKPPPHETPAAKARRQKTTGLFLVRLHHIFAPRNCHKE